MSARTALLLCMATSFTASLAAAPNGWIHDGSDRPPRLSVEQAIWAMGGLPRGGPAWSFDERIAKIAEAGFDGFMVWVPSSTDEQDRYRDLAAKHGLAITLQYGPSNLEELAVALEAAQRMKARALVGMIRPTFVSYSEGEDKIVSMSRAAAEAGVPFYVEVHRGTITQDLSLTASWAENIPGIQIHADLSHPVVSYEVGGPPSGHIARAFESILARTGMIDGRVSNGKQVQIDIGPAGDTKEAKLFASWWKRAMVKWLRAAKPGDVFVFKSELGPPGYSIVGPDGREISDRWAQALVMRDLGIRTWNEAVQEAGVGELYDPNARAKSVAVASDDASKGGGDEPSTPKAGSPKNWLETSESGVPVLRGDSFRIGDFHLAGQPLQPDFDIAKELGIKTVINLRLPQELAGIGFDEKQYMETIGLAYRHFPTGPDDIDDELAEKMLDALDKCEKPVLIHDSNGNRVWGLWALYLAVRHDIPIDETEKVAKEHGIRRLVIDAFARDYVERKGKK